MPNGLLAILVATACVAAAMVQGSRAESAGVYYVESQAQQHAAIGNDVRRSAQASAGLTQDQRVDRFLRDRENVAYAFMPRHVDERKDPQTTTTQPTLAKPLRT
jgi:hypothetical protein